MDEKILEEIGLSKNEIKVYLALLKIGKTTSLRIINETGISVSALYYCLENLVKKGLASYSVMANKKNFQATPPEQLVSLLETKKQKLEEIIPELKSMHNVTDRPKVFFYEGREGMEKVYEDTLTSHEPIRAYATPDDMHAGLPGYFPDYYHRRAKAGIFIRAIAPKTEIGVERREHDKEEKREIAFVPGDKYYFSPEINIYDNKVMIASWREKLGIIIESSEIADAMKKIYELAWAEAKRLDAELNKEI